MKKGGGRESDKAGARAGTVRRDDPEAVRDRSAAANPAALMLQAMTMEQLMDLVGLNVKLRIDPSIDARAVLRMRIHDMEERIRELEAELAEYRAWFANPQEAEETVRRAERAKARLAEADACLEKLGVTWSGTAYIGMGREREES